MERTPFYRVIGLIWRSGTVVFLSAIPFAGMTGFLALTYVERDWSGAGIALAAFSTGFILVRLVGGHLPDQFGATRVAIISLAVETLGQVIIWLAPHPHVALLGALVTGVGFSLIFPSMGVAATRRVPVEQRGRAAAGLFGCGTTFVIGAVAAICALVLAASG